METVSAVLTWALCGGILAAVVGLWLYVFARVLWMTIKKR